MYPQISGDNVVWEGDGIFFWDGTTITQVTNNPYNDDDPQISGNNVVWHSSDSEIFFWNEDSVFNETL